MATAQIKNYGSNQRSHSAQVLSSSASIGKLTTISLTDDRRDGRWRPLSQVKVSFCIDFAEVEPHRAVALLPRALHDLEDLMSLLSG